MTVSTGATRSTVLKVSNALNPTDATVLLHVGTDHTGGEASSDAAMLTDRDYTFDPGASGDRGTLTITVPMAYRSPTGTPYMSPQSLCRR